MSEYKYKDSGVAWIGQIPEHWDTIKIKYTSWLKGRIGWQGLTSDEYQDEGAYLITGTDFCEGRINWDTCVHISEERFAEDEDIHIKEGDLLITKDGTIGKVAVAKDCPDEVSLNSGVMLIRNTGDFKYHDQYLYYTLLSDEFWDWYEMSQTGASTIRHLYQEQFYTFEYAYPSVEEQKIIASYLDKKVNAINESIKELESTIEEYQKWKASVIYKAVTQGIDDSLQMKETDLPGNPSIPIDWFVTRFKYVISIKSGDAIRNEELIDEGACPVYGGGEKIGYTNKSNCGDGDILVGRVGARCGITTIITEDSWATDNALVISTDNHSKYVYYLLTAANLNSLNTSNAQPLITATKVKNCYCAYTDDILMQERIAEFIDNKCQEIDELIQEKELLIQDMVKYKKSLIFEVVTGKRKVV